MGLPGGIFSIEIILHATKIEFVLFVEGFFFLVGWFGFILGFLLLLWVVDFFSPEKIYNQANGHYHN